MTDINEQPTTEERAIELLASPLWRLNNLYSIVDREGRLIPFRLNKQQELLARAIYEGGQRRVIVLKARQLGFSTLFEVMALDAALWSENKQASICADTDDNAKKLLKGKVFLAFDNLPAELRDSFCVTSRNESSISFSNGGSVHSAVRVRSGTNQFLHVSELGKISHRDPERAREIRNGAFPTVSQDGIIAIESTFEGGKHGLFYDIITQAMEVPDAEKTPLDFHFHFFPWYEEPSYSLDNANAPLRDTTLAYFKALSEKLGGHEFTTGQMLWWQKQKDTLGDDMNKEFPSTPAEAFEVPIEGSIYGEVISAARAKGRILDFDWDKGLPVHTFWDIGWGDTTAIWFVQFVGREVHFIDFIEASGEPCSYYARNVLSKPYGAPSVFLPHDAASTEKGSGLSYRQQLTQAGLVRTHIIPRTPDVWIGINRLRLLLERSCFHKTNCARGIECLEAYHKKRNEKLAVFEEVPVHDWASNAADAARYVAEALEAGLVGKEDASPDVFRERIKHLPRMAITGMPRR